MNEIQIVALVLVMAGLAIPVMCVVKYLAIKRFRQGAVVTEAEVMESERKTGYRSVYYILRIKYKTIDGGQLYNGQFISGKKRKIGDTIPLMYANRDPAVFKTDFGKRLPWLFGFGIIFLALICWFCYWLLALPFTNGPA